MLASRRCSNHIRNTFALAACALSCNVVVAGNLLLSDGREFPGQLWESRSGASAQRLHRREATADRAFPQAEMKLGKVAVGADGKVYFVSGLDGYVLHLLDGRHEVLSFEFPGQVRDVDCGGEEHTVYFSVVPTPQNNEPLADGKIYRRDLWQGQPSEVATVRQADVGGDWWGAFTVSDGDTYIATLSTPSRLYKLTSAGAVPVFTSNQYRIEGFAADDDGGFVFTDGAGGVYRTSDFETCETLIRGDRKFTDVAMEPDARVGGGQ